MNLFLPFINYIYQDKFVSLCSMVFVLSMNFNSVHMVRNIRNTLKENYSNNFNMQLLPPPHATSVLRNKLTGLTGHAGYKD